MRTETVKQYKWVKVNDSKKIVNVWVHKEKDFKDFNEDFNDNNRLVSEKSYVTISGYNPFPFFGNTEFKTSYKIFSEWMKKNGYEPVINVSHVFMDKTQIFN